MIIVFHTIVLGVVLHCYKSAEIKNGQISTVEKELIQTHINVNGKELILDAYYSEKEQAWCFTLPALYENSKFNVVLQKKQKVLSSVERKPGESLVFLQYNDEVIPIKFLCANNVETLFVDLEELYTLEDVHEDKEREVSGYMSCEDSEGQWLYLPIEVFSGHGNDSWKASKKSYDIKFASELDLFGMGRNQDYVLLAGYRDNSLMSFCVTGELIQQIGFAYAPEFRLVNLYIEGNYLGVYFLTEKIEIDKNRIDIYSVYEETKTINGKKTLESSECECWTADNGVTKRYFYHVPENPLDISGGYLLELDTNNRETDVSRFTSDRSNKMTLKRARYSSKEQVSYIANYWQEFENALYSENGYNDKGKYYAEYIDLESFAMQWLIYELLQETSMHSSIYYYKESDIHGDGLLHACYPWDLEHSYLMNENIDELWNVKVQDEYWSQYYKHEDFRVEVEKIWQGRFVPVVERMIEKEVVWENDGFKNISGYQKECATLYRLDGARWSDVDSMQKCELIREFLQIRLDVLNDILNKK